MHFKKNIDRVVTLFAILIFDEWLPGMTLKIRIQLFIIARSNELAYVSPAGETYAKNNILSKISEL